MIGSVILVCDIWIVLEGLRLLVRTKRGSEWTSAS